MNASHWKTFLLGSILFQVGLSVVWRRTDPQNGQGLTSTTGEYFTLHLQKGVCRCDGGGRALRREITLDHPSRPMSLQGPLSPENLSWLWPAQGRCDYERRVRKMQTSGLKMEAVGQKPRQVGTLYELEKARKGFLSQSLQRGTQHCWHFDFSPVRLVLDFQPAEL